MLGSHCLFQKFCMYEESIRTPISLRIPGSLRPKIGADRRPTGPCDALVSAVDVVPTLCDLLDLEKPRRLSGLSLVPAMRGEPLARDRIFLQFDGNGARGNFQRAVIRAPSS